MPYKIERDDELDLTRLTISGFVNLEGLFEALLALRDSPRFNYRTLMVYEPNAEVDLSQADLRELAAFSREERPADAPYGRTAVVTPKDFLFGLNRMYQVFHEATPAAFRVFRDVDEAIEWLQEVPPGVVPDDTP